MSMTGSHANPDGFAASSKPLPYGLTPQALVLMVEIAYELLDGADDTGRRRPSLREWARKGGISGLFSDAIVYALANACGSAFVSNAKTDGFPDVLLRGKYRGNKARAARDGIEVKVTTRTLTQTDVAKPRPGWYLVAQLAVDERGNDLPTISDVYLARLTLNDFGTVRINSRGAAKLRRGLVYHDEPRAASLPIAA